MSVPELRGSKVKGQSTEYCVEVVVSGRLTQTWLRYSELRDLSQRLKGVKGKITLIEGLFRRHPSIESMIKTPTLFFTHVFVCSEMGL